MATGRSGTEPTVTVTVTMEYMNAWDRLDKPSLHRVHRWTDSFGLILIHLAPVGCWYDNNGRRNGLTEDPFRVPTVDWLMVSMGSRAGLWKGVCG